MDLKRLGWRESAGLEQIDLDLGRTGRVLSTQRNRWTVQTAHALRVLPISGKLRERGTHPVTGDFVICDDGLQPSRIKQILPRRTVLSRAGTDQSSTPRVMAANLDWVLIVTTVGADFNSNRLERYLAVAWESGATPLVLVNKIDLHGPPPGLSPSLSGAEVLRISARTGEGFDELNAYLKPATTAVLIGSSGVGKSTITNQLLNRPQQPTLTVRPSDQKGRHTTTSRQLFMLASGAMLIDTPGLREVGTMVTPSAIDLVFDQIAELAQNCKFRDCSHDSEPGCAVRGAVERGQLDPRRLHSQRKLARERDYIASRDDQRVRNQRKESDKRIHRQFRRTKHR